MALHFEWEPQSHWLRPIETRWDFALSSHLSTLAIGVSVEDGIKPSVLIQRACTKRSVGGRAFYRLHAVPASAGCADHQKELEMWVVTPQSATERLHLGQRSAAKAPEQLQRGTLRCSLLCRSQMPPVHQARRLEGTCFDSKHPFESKLVPGTNAKMDRYWKLCSCEDKHTIGGRRRGGCARPTRALLPLDWFMHKVGERVYVD